MVIDCHCRAGNTSLTPYLRRADHAGIDRTVLFASFKSDYSAANADVARLVSSRPDRFIGFVCIHPARDRGRVRDLVRGAVQAHGFRGIAVHRHDAPLTREICEAALLFGVPVVYDVMGDVAPMEVIAEEYPGVDFILPHLGTVAGEEQAERALLDLLEHKPNVYADTAGTQRFDFLEEALARAGANKVLFGSGGPLRHPGLELAKILLLKLKPEEHRRVVGGNLLRLISGRSVRREHRLDAVATPRPVRIGDVASEANAVSTQESGPVEEAAIAPEVVAAPLPVEGLEIRARNPSTHLQGDPDRGAPDRSEDRDPPADLHPGAGEGLAPAPATPPAILGADAWAGVDTVTISLAGQLATFVVDEDAASNSGTSTAVAAAVPHDSLSASLTELVESASFGPDAITSPLPGPVESAAPGP